MRSRMRGRIGMMWKSVPLEGLLFVLLMIQTVLVESVVTAEWSITEEYVMAWINVTYVDPFNGKLHTQNTEVN
jgi:hypothetical protein